MDKLHKQMKSNRKRITGRLDQTPRGYAIIAETGDHWVLEEYEPNSELMGTVVTVEGVVTGLDRMRAEWMGSAVL